MTFPPNTDIYHFAHILLREHRAAACLEAPGAPLEAVQPPGVVGGVSTAYSTLAAAETAPGRGPITQCRLLLGGKQT